MKGLLALSALSAATGFIGGIALMAWLEQREMQDAINDAGKIQTQRQVITERAKTLDADAERLRTVVLDRERDILRLRDKLNATQAKLQTTLARPIPEDLAPRLDELQSRILVLVETTNDQTKLIQAQDAAFSGLQAQLLATSAARDAWKRSAEEGGREAVQLRAALAAQQGIAKSALLRGRIQGFALGFASGAAGGYVAGRF